MLTLSPKIIDNKAKRLRNRLKKLGDARLETLIMKASSRVGGGALPLQELPTKCVGVKIEGLSANAIERLMRESMPPVIGYIEEDLFVMDARTIQDEEIAVIASTFKSILMGG
jgi:L-seryl-tRNA(Ser) seleniumtransferase